MIMTNFYAHLDQGSQPLCQRNSEVCVLQFILLQTPETLLCTLRWCHKLVAGICLFTEASWQFVRGHLMKRRSVIMEAPPSPRPLPPFLLLPLFVWPLPISLSLPPLAAVFVQHRLLPIHSVGSNARSCWCFTSAHYNASVFTFPAEQYAQHGTADTECYCSNKGP